MLKLIITDVGGVLIKTDEAIVKCIETVFQANNIAVGSRDKLLSVFGTSIFDYIKNYLPAGYEDKSDFCYQEFKKLYPSQVKHLMTVFPQVNETLSQIKKQGINICVLSCMMKNEVEANLSLLDFKDFDIIFSLEDYGDKRPLPNGLQMIMKQLGIAPDQTIYIGDTVNDIQMAKNAGVVSVAVKTGAQSNEQLIQANPDYLLDHFYQLTEVLNKLNNINNT
jgi:phosphoglycolate phosphatase